MQVAVGFPTLLPIAVDVSHLLPSASQIIDVYECTNVHVRILFCYKKLRYGAGR